MFQVKLRGTKGKIKGMEAIVFDDPLYIEPCPIIHDQDDHIISLANCFKYRPTLTQSKQGSNFMKLNATES